MDGKRPSPKRKYSTTIDIAEAMLPHIAGRPATRKRWPNGVDEASVLREAARIIGPDWLNRASITHRSGTTTYPIIDTVEALAWIGQQAALEVHVPQWRFVLAGVAGLARRAPGPTRLVFDLDPGEGVTMKQLCEVARAVQDLMGDIGSDDVSRSPAAARACICTRRSRSRSARAVPWCWPNALRSSSNRPCRSWSPPP